MEKVLSKKLLDELIELHRAYNGMGAHSTEEMAAHCGLMIAKASELERLNGATWHSINDLLSGCISSGGLNEAATNEDIYRLLAILGWKVVRKVKVHIVTVEE